MTVRLIGIDAPERSHPSLGKEFFSDEAAAHLASLCRGKTVRMEKDAEETDKYDRLLRYVFLPPPDGRLLNEEMLRAGHGPRLHAVPLLQERRVSRRRGEGATGGEGTLEGRGDGGSAVARRGERRSRRGVPLRRKDLRPRPQGARESGGGARGPSEGDRGDPAAAGRAVGHRVRVEGPGPGVPPDRPVERGPGRDRSPRDSAHSSRLPRSGGRSSRGRKPIATRGKRSSSRGRSSGPTGRRRCCTSTSTRTGSGTSRSSSS